MSRFELVQKAKPFHRPLQDIHLWERDIRSCNLKLKFMKIGIMISIRSMVQGQSSAFLPGLVSAFSLAPCAGALGRSVLKCFDARQEK